MGQVFLDIAFYFHKVHVCLNYMGIFCNIFTLKTILFLS